MSSFDERSAELKEHERRAAVILDGMYQFVALLNSRGDILEVNRAALEGAGHGIEEIRGKPFWTARWWQVSEQIKEDLKVAIRRAAAGEFVRYEVDIYGEQSGLAPITIDFSLQPIRGESGEVEYLLPEGRNITERKQAEDQVARQAQELRVLNERLNELDRLKTRFFANVSHEFRTPLTLLLGPLEDALANTHDILPLAAAEDLRVSHRNALRLLKLVNTMLDFSRIEAGRIEALYQPIELGVLTAELASNFRSACEKAGLRLVVDCPPLSEPVYVDRDMWEKIVLNLVSNAFKFTLDGEIEVSLSSHPLSHVTLTVRDTGVGIPLEELPRMFERFHRIEYSRGRTHEGTGIGLALVQELVKFHGGAVRVQSVLGEGSTFIVTIPFGTAHLDPQRIGTASELAPAGIDSSAFVEEALRWLPDDDGEQLGEQTFAPVLAASDRVSVAVQPHGQRARILWADDNADMREYVSRLLGGSFDVLAVADGQAALEAARAEPPDLVLSDIMMPRLDGFGLLLELRADPRLREIPIILLSARAGEESRIEGLEAGADDYLIKPFSARELLARVGAHLAIARVRREATEKVRSSEVELRDFVENANVGLHRVSPDGIILWANQTELDLLGYTREEYIGHSIAEFYVDASVSEDILTRLTRGERVLEYETGMRCKDGSIRHVLINCSGFFEDGKFIHTRCFTHDITERKLAEKAEARLAAIVESSEDGIISKDLNGIITSWNLGAERLFGYTAAEVIGQPISMLIPPERLDEEPNILQRIRRGERIEHYETVRRRKDGTLLDISLTVSPIVDAHGHIVGASKIARDITERKLAERKLGESEERFRTMADSSPILIWMTDGEGQTSFRNRTYLEYFGVTAEEAPAFDWSGIVHPDDRGAYAAAFQTALQKRQTFHQRARLRRFDGQWRWFEARGNPIFDDAGNMVGFIGSSPDITDIYESQQMLKELDQRKDEFLANMSHEIRSPLTGIMGFADILLNRLKDPDDIECLRTIKESGDYLIEIVNDILDLSKIEAGKLVLNLEAVPVHSVLAEIQALMDVRAKQKSLPLVLRYDGMLPPSIHTDRTRLRQILINLVSNAIKFTESGRVEIVARFLGDEDLLANRGARVFQPASNRRTGMSALQIEVIDTGIGIAPEHQEILFQPFTQADSTSTRKYGGTGLGLTITKRLVEMLGGSISFESGLGQGSTFRVMIPTGPVQESLPAAAVPIGPTLDELRLRDLHVLVVDDREEICYLVSRYIKDAGGRTTAVTDGEAALDVIEAAGKTNPFHAVIMDIQMPGIDGYETTRRLRAKGFRTPIIALTAGAMVGDREKCLQAGCDDYLTKPIDRQKLVQLVAQHAQKAVRAYNANGSKLKILLVDDSHNTCTFLSRFLEKRGHEVRLAYDGESALTVAQDFRPGVILLDIRLPDMNGYELMERLKELDVMNGARFIALSGYRDVDAPGQGSVAFDHFLEKPVDVVQLQALLNSRYR